ncbi:MAG: hypothetical protein R3F56_00640 [Planctomycetota bacterium]
MVLAALAGYGVQHFAGVSNATAFGLLLGMLVAPFVPGPGACGPRASRTP